MCVSEYIVADSEIKVLFNIFDVKKKKSITNSDLILKRS